MYVLLYNVTELAVDLDSDYAEQVLKSLHPNISVSQLYTSKYFCLGIRMQLYANFISLYF